MSRDDLEEMDEIRPGTDPEIVIWRIYERVKSLQTSQSVLFKKIDNIENIKNICPGKDEHEKLMGRVIHLENCEVESRAERLMLRRLITWGIPLLGICLTLVIFFANKFIG